MISAARGLTARYKQELTDNQGNTKTYFDERDVIAFDGDGDALVIDGESGQLVPANRWHNFAGIREDSCPRLVALIPANGWRVKWQSSDETWTQPLAGWGLRIDGTVVPLDACADGTVTELFHAGEGWQVYHPDGPPLSKGGAA